MSATRGVGKANSAVCKNDRELIRGLCYEKCRQGYIPRGLSCVDETCAYSDSKQSQKIENQ
jgi:hypothetical protein